MAVKIKWHGPQVNKQLKNATAQGIQRATVFLHTKCREAVNVPNSSEKRERKRSTSKGRKGSSYTVYPNPSSPGEPPRKRTGWGQRHVMWTFDKDKIIGRVGVATNAIYMIYLELGTRFISPRPWLVATLKKNLRMLGLLASTGGKGRKAA